MKRIWIILLLVCTYISTLKADDDVNVLRYYAVDNSLDGQPAIEMVNVLRFYPVFAMQDSIYSVLGTIYYGANRFTRNAESMNEGKFWQVLLPKFKLGEAIQRIEVEVHFSLNSYVVERYKMLNELKASAEKLREVEFEAKNARWIHIFEEKGFTRDQAEQLQSVYQTPWYESLRDSLINDLVFEDMKKLVTMIVDSLVKFRAETRQDYLKTLSESDSFRNNLRTALLEEVEVLADTLYTGPSIKKSDIIIVEDENDPIRPVKAKILYRNYKKSLRRMQALDPVERMGIFRVRYVPFPVVGIEESAKMRLLAPLQSNSPTVFEIGLSFGDAIVPGDEFVVPSFSFDRLGVAFAITEELFDKKATVRALVLTYDFNSYGSLGVGANFPGDKVRGYFSFGINKRAFENALAGLAKLFQ